ncbi:hypothetical protein CsSME_00032194 [Camellia sinensis var. sinensis]
MVSTSQPRPLDNHHKTAGAIATTITTTNYHIGALALSKMIRQDLIMMKEAIAEVQKKTDHMNVQINQVYERFEELKTRGGMRLRESLAN